MLAEEARGLKHNYVGVERFCRNIRARASRTAARGSMPYESRLRGVRPRGALGCQSLLSPPSTDGRKVSEHDPSAYGAAVSADYDMLYPESHDAHQTDATVALIAELARSGGHSAVLEFGVGTGRLAIALVDRGFRVSGIEGSGEMLARLRAKPRGKEVHVVLGDFVSTQVDGLFSVVFMALNTIFAPGTRSDQVECFRNAARHLEPGGCFVVEAYLLQPEQLSGSWSIWPRSVQADHVELQLARYDLPTNRVERTLVHLRPEGLHLVSVIDSYAWPGELDLMADITGFDLDSRHGGWAGEPFSASSGRHVSIYRLRDLGSP